MRKPTKLRAAIFASGRRQKDIAAEVGIDEAAMSRIANGLRCSSDMCNRIASVLDLPVTDLFDVEPGERAA